MNDIVCLSESQTRIKMKIQDRVAAIDAAFNVTMSPHEHEWTREQQVAMAQYVLWSSQRLDAIAAISRGDDMRREKAADNEG